MASSIPVLYQNPATGISAPAAYVGEFAVTANTTLKVADSGKLYTNLGASGAVVFTLPSISAGLYFGFLVNAGQTVTVSSAEGNNIVWFNTVAGNSLSFNTSNGKIGGWLDFMSSANGTLWYVQNKSASPNTSGGNVVTLA